MTLEKSLQITLFQGQELVVNCRSVSCRPCGCHQGAVCEELPSLLQKSQPCTKAAEVQRDAS